MTIEEALYTYLSTYAGLAALCGTRVYPIELPQEVTLPAVSYYRVSGPREYAFGGVTGVAMPRFQVTAWAETYAGCRAVAEQIRLALQSYEGVMGGVGGVYTVATLLNETDLLDTETGWHYCALDFELWHQEA